MTSILAHSNNSEVLPTWWDTRWDSNRIMQRTKGQMELNFSFHCIDELSLPFRVSHHPLWPTEAQIRGMVATGSLTEENIFVWPDRWKEFKRGYSAAQAMGYTIAERAKYFGHTPRELAKSIITDPEALKQVLAIIEAWDDVTMYVGNQKFHEAWLKHLGKRGPTPAEQLTIWDQLNTTLSWSGIVTTQTVAGIPLIGYFDMESGRFVQVGVRAILRSSNPNERRVLNLRLGEPVKNIGYEGLNVACSTLVIEDNPGNNKK